ncbi:MAG: MoxR family ATPase [Candidatus Methanomethylicia archaeon]|nr:MoxR family ATPase [Candidatus Methanomethylicia archaeon]
MSDIINKIIEEIENFIVGKKEVIKMMLVALISEGHILLEGPPGTAKTLMAKTFAKAIGLSFSRIQMTPDMLPADIIGTVVYDAKNSEFKVKKGPIFANIVLIDELNRAPAKTQAAFLEVMQERQVTIEGISYLVDRPFLVIATQMPYGSAGTYPLTEVQIDRFSYNVKITHASAEEEMKILEKIDFIETNEVKQVVEKKQILELIEEARRVYVSEAIRKYIVDLVTWLRNNNTLLEGPSARASIWLMKASRAYALINGRNYVIPDDIKAIAPYVLRHRIQLKREMIEEINEDQIIEEAINTVPVPKR